MEVAEDVARQEVALLQAQSIGIATVESTAGPFFGPYHAAVDLVASADDATMAKAYMVGMVVPQEQLNEEDSASDDIEALFSDSLDGDAVVPTTMDEQVALLASFETAHHEQGTRQFMAAEREAVEAMLVVRSNAARQRGEYHGILRAQTLSESVQIGSFGSGREQQNEAYRDGLRGNLTVQRIYYPSR
jgi:hypothetical protein